MIKRIMVVFIAAMIIRLLMWLIITGFGLRTGLTLEETGTYLWMDKPPAVVQLADASDYTLTIENGMDVPEMIGKYWGYENWYERQPLHMIVLYLTNGSILFQILLSSLTVAFLYRLNSIAGWIFAFYPQAVIYSCLTAKVTLMTFMLVLAMYLFRERQWWIVIAALAIQMSMSSIFNYFPATPGIMAEFQRGYIDKIVHLWQPAFNHTQIVVGNWIMYVQAPAYLILMWFYVRKARWNYAGVIMLIFTIGAAMQYAHEFHREFLIPMILVEVLNED